MHVVVIGAGIAGLAAAWRVAALGVAVTVLEREALPFTHSSARNAAIFRPLESSEPVVHLAARSEQLLAELDAEPIVRRVGLLLTANMHSSLLELLQVANTASVPHEALTATELYARYPELSGGRAEHAVWLPTGGVLDLHRLCEALRAKLRALGVQVRLNTAVDRISTTPSGVDGVVISGHETLPCDAVVIAAGAWAQTLGVSAGAPLQLIPHRRHLVLLLPTTNDRLPSTRSVVWDVETGVYFRPESAGVLACPGDHEPTQAGVPPVSQAAIEPLAVDLPALCPSLSSYAMVRPWACLRTMTTSRSMAIGADPRVPGLYWLAGLGGQGMSAGLGAADLLARSVSGEVKPVWSQTFEPERHLVLSQTLTDETAL